MRRPAVLAWALYDLANTTFSLNVVSRYLPLIVVQDLGGRDLDVSLAYSGSMIAVAVASPLLGALSDLVGRRMPFLAAATFAAVIATAMMGFGAPALWLLACFAVANFFYQSALVFYDALLATVSDAATRGRASGFGIALGYVGAIVSLYTVAPFAERYGKAAAFPVTAAIFFVFALPCLLVVREPRGGAPWRRGLVGAAGKRVRGTLARLPSFPGLGRFLCAHFLYTDAVNTVIVFMAVYVTVVGGFTSTEVTGLLALSTVFAIVGALAAGPVVDRIGARRGIYVALGFWTVGLALAIVAPGKAGLWLVGPLTGTGMGSLWTADRVLMLRLSPQDALGEFYGLYGMVGRFAAITGPLIWGTIVYLMEGSGALAYRTAIGSLLIMVLAGWAVLSGVPDPGAGEVRGLAARTDAHREA